MRKLAYISVVLMTLISASSNGKDCECQQHKAGASGTGSCSLTESSSKCSISYTASSSKTTQSSAEQARASAARIAADAKIQGQLEMSFQILNERQPTQISLDEFRAVTVGAFAATGSPDALSSWIRRMRLEGSWGRPDNEFERLHSQFQRTGCIEFVEPNTRTRFLLISRFSNQDGQCRN
jgi:hypothetical protein